MPTALGGEIAYVVLRANARAYHLLREGGIYQDLGTAHLDLRDRTRVRHRLIERLQQLGYAVHLEETTAA